MTAPTVLRTARLELVAATLDLVLAELSGRPALSRLLRADVPDSWPPGEYDRDALEFFRARLAADPGAAGWYGWYAIAVGGDGTERSLVAAAGFLGPPDTDGMVEIGYSALPEERGKGHAACIGRAVHRRARGRLQPGFGGGPATLRLPAYRPGRSTGQQPVRTSSNAAAGGRDGIACRWLTTRPASQACGSSSRTA